MGSAIMDGPPTSPPPPPDGDDGYTMTVLRFTEKEEDMDTHMLQQAAELGVPVPALDDDMDEALAALSLSKPRVESRNSNSHGTTSDSSIESRLRTPSVAATSMTSIHSSHSQKSGRLKKGIRRISTMRRRDERDDSPEPPVPMLPDSDEDRPVRSDYDSAAHDRSHSNAVLCKLRSTQLQEQLRYICFRATQTRALRQKHVQLKREAVAEWRRLQDRAEIRHAEALHVLERRHLLAEDEMRKQLQTDRHACETRLKHMQAYVNSAGEQRKDVPTRRVTEADYKKLEQQYHLRNNIDTLNKNRFDAMRARQVKQVEREIDRQEQEFEKMRAEHGKNVAQQEQECAAEEEQLARVFLWRKNRLTRRWDVTEAIERRKLERATGLAYAPLPPINWGADEDVEEQEAEVQRLLAEKKIAIDPDSGVMMMEEEYDYPPPRRHERHSSASSHRHSQHIPQSPRSVLSQGSHRASMYPAMPSETERWEDLGGMTEQERRMREVELEAERSVTMGKYGGRGRFL